MKLTTNCLPALGRFTVAAVAGFTVSMPAFAQGEEGSVFEEIVVIGDTKNLDNVMDTATAITALSGPVIEDSSIKDVFDLQQNVPSLIVGQSQTATTSNFQIRSVGSTSNNFGVESSVGLFVDGVYRSRQSSIINELIDIEAVEVARGPQGTLFGKNTAAGAIQIRTVRPGHDSNAFVEVTAGDFGLTRVSAAGNIALSDDVAMRATIFSSQRDGYVADLAAGSDFYNDRDRFGVRLQLAGGEPSDDLNWRLIADYSEIDEVCCAAVSRVDNLFSRASLAGVPVNGSDALVLGLGGTVFTDFPYPAPFLAGLRAAFPQGTIIENTGFDSLIAAYDILPQSKNEDSGLSFELNYTMGNGMTFTSVSGYRSFDTFDLIDADFNNAPLLGRTNDAEQSSFSQEFRLAGDIGSSGSTFVLGAYYFDQEVTNVKGNTDPGLLSFFFNSDPRFVTIAAAVNQISALYGPGGLIADLGFLPAGIPALPGNQAIDNTTHNQDGYAVFGQVDLNVTDSLAIVLGARFTDESKDTSAIYTQSLPSNQPRPDFGLMGILLCSLDAACAATLPPGLPAFNPLDPLSLAVFSPFFVDGWGTFAFDPLAPRPDFNESISDDQVTGTAKIIWDTSAGMFYASYATGFKSGGTNDDRINPAFSQSFGPETSESIEIGFKGFLGERLRVGIAIYDTEFEDFQANAFTGTGFNLQNAGVLDTNGYEVEFSWRPTDTFELAGFYAKNEGEFKSFVEGTCWDATPFHTGVPDPGLPPAFNPLLALERCDRTGGKLPYNPETNAFVSATKDFHVGENTLFARLEFAYYDEQFTDGDLDPFMLQDSVSILNASIGYDFTDWNATLRLWGRNITDEIYYHGSFDAPAQDGRVMSYPSEPASYGITFRKSFD